MNNKGNEMFSVTPAQFAARVERLRRAAILVADRKNGPKGETFQAEPPAPPGTEPAPRPS